LKRYLGDLHCREKAAKIAEKLSRKTSRDVPGVGASTTWRGATM
jgi:hypothetical protein